MASFDLDIVYLKGTDHEVADALSRLPSASLKASKLATTVSTHILQNWMGVLTKDKYFGPIIQTLRTGSTNTKALKRAAIYEIAGNQLIFKMDGMNRICVPKLLQLETMKVAHDERCGGHMGIMKPQISLKKSHFWPRMSQVKKYVTSCRSCHGKVRSPIYIQQSCLHSRSYHQQQDGIRWPWILSPALPLTKRGFDAILTVTDILTDRVIFDQNQNIRPQRRIQLSYSQSIYFVNLECHSF